VGVGISQDGVSELFNTGAADYCLPAPFGQQISANKEKKIAFLERDSYKRF
jgi:hypothetical protein